jgi:hypothetical protein
MTRKKKGTNIPKASSVAPTPKKRGRKRLSLEIDIDTPYPVRGDRKDLVELKQMIRHSVPKLRVKKYSFKIPKGKRTTVAQFLRQNFKGMTFRYALNPQDKKVMNVFRRS